MKRIIKILFLIITIATSCLFITNIFSLSYINMDVKLLIPLIFSVITQFIWLDNLKTSKKIVMILLIALLNLISFLLLFLISGFIFPHSGNVDISLFAEMIGYSLIIINFFIISIIQMFLINKSKADDESKSQCIKKVCICQLIIIVVDIIILIWANK